MNPDTERLAQPTFLPMSRREMQALGWDELDVLLVTGDAYVDHPSFGAALIGRHLVACGWRVGIVAQPDWRDPQSVARLGRPRLFAGVTAGAMDSMVANYTANKKIRHTDTYAPGGQGGLRPNRASLVYTSLVRHAFPGLPVVLGGIEASLRRLAHYDYWEDGIRRSILLDAKADLLVFGMGERAVQAIAERLAAGASLAGIPGTALVRPSAEGLEPIRRLPSYEEVAASRAALVQAALLAEAEPDWRHAHILVQAHGTREVVVYPPAQPLDTAELDAIYALPFARAAHPLHEQPVPALEPVRHSIVSHRGCFGGCTFCALGLHQGKQIQSRSPDSILEEVRRLTARRDFHGTISDVGGPSANMYGMSCRRPAGECRRPSCLHPTICGHLETDHAPQIALLDRVAKLPGVKHVFVASGIRYDLAMEDGRYLEALVAGGHVSGTLKVAPEHVEPAVLALMRKPTLEAFERFLDHYRDACRRQGRPAHATAYFISAFPGSGPEDSRRIADFATRHDLHVEPMQDFIPLPMTLAGVMYAAGVNPWTGAPLRVTRSTRERVAQRQVLLSRSSGPGAATRPGAAAPPRGGKPRRG